MSFFFPTESQHRLGQTKNILMVLKSLLRIIVLKFCSVLSDFPTGSILAERQCGLSQSKPNHAASALLQKSSSLLSEDLYLQVGGPHCPC